MSQQINLYTPAAGKGEKQLSFSANTMLYAGLMVMVAVMSFSFYGQYQLTHLKKQAQISESLLKTEQTILAKLSTDLAAKKTNSQLQTDITRLEGQLAGRQQVLNTLRNGVLGDTKGFSEYLRAFAHQPTNGVWLTGFSIVSTNKQMEIWGRALDADLVPTYIRRLNNEPALKGRAFSGLQISQPKNTVAERKEAKPALRYIEFKLSGDDKRNKSANQQTKGSSS